MTASEPLAVSRRWLVHLRSVEPIRWSAIAEGVSCPAAVATGERRVTLFARGSGSELVVLERDADAWSEPRSLGVPLARPAGSRSPTMPVDWPIEIGRASCRERG